MLTQIAAGVHVHVSDFLLTNTVVVQGSAGVLLIDPGLTESELRCLADDLHGLEQAVIAGFSTHPDWDHVLWHPELGDAPRYGTARGAETIRTFLSEGGAKARIEDHLPEEIAGQVPMELFGLITGLPAGTVKIPWDGPDVRIIEHQAHAPGHAALVIKERGVLIAGDMLSDVLVPMLDFDGTPDPIGDYLIALDLLEAVVGDVAVAVPGHGTVATAGEIQARIDLDRAYVIALRDGQSLSDPRIGASAKPGWEWVSSIHEGQLHQLEQRNKREVASD